MRKHILWYLYLAAMLFVGASAQAANGGAGGFTWYLTGGVTGSDLETDALVEAGAQFGVIVSDEISDTAFGYQLGGGVMFTDNFGLEVKYSDSGDAEDDIFVSEPGGFPLPVSADLSLDGFTLYAVAETSFADSWDVFGKLGYTSQDADVELSFFGVAPETVSDDDDGFAVAGGIRYRFTPSWAVTAEIEYWDIDFDGVISEPLRGSVNLQYYFGR